MEFEVKPLRLKNTQQMLPLCHFTFQLHSTHCKGKVSQDNGIRDLSYTTISATHCKGKVSQDDDIRDLSYMSEEEQVEYLIKMTQEETLLDEKAGIERVSPEPAGKFVNLYSSQLNIRN